MAKVGTFIQVVCHEDTTRKPQCGPWAFPGDESITDAIIPIAYDEEEVKELCGGDQGLPDELKISFGDTVKKPQYFLRSMSNGVLTDYHPNTEQYGEEIVMIEVIPQFHTNHSKWCAHAVAELFDMKEKQSA